MFTISPQIVVVCVLAVLSFSSITCNETATTSSSKRPVSSVYAVQGRRGYMEDTFIREENVCGTGIYAIFDGHAGNYSSIAAAEKFGDEIAEKLKLSVSNPTECSCVNGKWLVKRKHDKGDMLKNLIQRMETHLENAFKAEVHESGTTCLIAIVEKNELTVANVGDSRGVLCDSKGNALDLSIDHKPNNDKEKKRIEKAGGEILNIFGTWRVNGLAMSRSLGDTHRKNNQKFIIWNPDIFVYNLKRYRPQFMILASDGLWDVMSSQEAVNYINDECKDETDLGATKLVSKALALNSGDNITVLIVKFIDGQYKVGSANDSE